MKYGNKSFRTWLDKAKETMCDDIESWFSSEVPGFKNAIDEIKAYLEESFGSHDRLDYTVNNELNFVIFLMCLFKVGVLVEEDIQGTVG